MAAARGFTLLELVVSIAILSVILTITVPFFRDFRANQELEQTAKTLVTDLRLAQSKAFAGVKDCGASTEILTGWLVSFSLSSYTITVRCGSTIGAGRIISLPSSMTLTTNIGSNSILFQPNNKEVALITSSGAITALPSDAIITLTKGAKTATVSVRKTGDIE